MRNKLFAAAWLVLAGAAQADEPKPIELDPPKVIPQPARVEMPMAFERQSMYRWQYYGVDRTGHFRPAAVLDCPGPPRYLYNGQIYPMLPVRQRDYMPMILN